MISTVSPLNLLNSNRLYTHHFSFVEVTLIYIAYQLLIIVLVMFKQTTQRLYQLLGKTKLEDLPPSWQDPMDRVLRRQEQAVSNTVI